jgi:molybdopterin-guanine dinucleotide biosynthesis protein A
MRGAVLAGGAASRYGGEPKGLLELGGRRILDRVVTAVAHALGELPLLVANAPRASAWRPDLRTVPDARPNCGSLGGIYTALVAGDRSVPVLCVAWDMPFVSTGLLRALIAEAASGQYDALLPESDGRRGIEPLCAVYGPACVEPVEQALDAGDLRAIAFHRSVRVGRLPLERVRQFGEPSRLFFNVNAPEDLARAGELLALGGSADDLDRGPA